MAGIGFELEKLFEKDTYAADFGAYLAAGFILAGAWVFSVLSIILITLYSSADLTTRNQALLLVITTYSYGGAMLVSSPLSLVVTRFIADRLYRGEADAFGPSYAAYCLIHWLLAAVVGAVFYSLNPLTPTVKILGILLLISCTQVWLSAAFISLLRAYTFVAASFAAGYALATLAAINLGQAYGVEGYLAGFTLGMMVLALLLTGQLATQFVYPSSANFGFVGLAVTRPSLALIGLGLAVGTWVDKVLFWSGADHAHAVTPLLRFYPDYDMSFFLGYVTCIPAYAHFLLRVETSFAHHVRHVYSCLVNRETYAQIHLAKEQLLEAMNRDFVGLLKVQLPVSMLAIYFAPEILTALKLPLHQSHIFQLSTLTSLGIVMLQVQILYLLYFDRPAAAAIPALLYAALNALFTWLTIKVGYGLYGLGHLAAAFTAATVGVMLNARTTPQLDYLALSHFASFTLAPARGPRPAVAPGQP